MTMTAVSLGHALYLPSRLWCFLGCPLVATATCGWCIADITNVLTAAFQQRPFTTAAVCEAAVRGAARHNYQRPDAIRMFASLVTGASYEVVGAPDGPYFSNSTAAAASDSSTRSALLLQFGLTLTTLKYCGSNCGDTAVFYGLLHHVGPTLLATVMLGGIAQCTLGLESVSSSSVEEQSVRVQAMQSWIHLCGRSMFTAGRQLLLALEEPAAVAASMLDGVRIQKVGVVHMQNFSRVR